MSTEYANTRPSAWDARKHKVMVVQGPVYHGTHKALAELLVSSEGPQHAGLRRFSVRQWVGPLGFYVTKIRERAIAYAKANGARWGRGTSDGRVLVWDAAELGLDRVLFVNAEPVEQDIAMAKKMGLSGVRGPADWGVLVFSPQRVAGRLIWAGDVGGKRRHAKPRRKRSLATLVRQAQLARAVRKLVK